MNNSCLELEKESEKIENKIKEIRRNYGENDINTYKPIFDILPVDTIYEVKETIVNVIKGIKSEIDQSRNKIKNSINKLHNNFGIDLIIIIDTTNTMFDYYDNIKNKIIKISEKIKEICFGVKLRIGFLGYKDYVDYDLDKESYINVPLTSDFNYLKSEIDKVVIGGGGDVPEDLAWGLQKAQKQLCDLNESSLADTKYVILITDAPCHGEKYHDLGKYSRDTNEKGDNYIKGDRNGIDIEAILKSMAKNCINFYCVKISDITDKMFKIFEEIYNKNKNEYYGGFEIVKNENPEHVPSYIIHSINKLFQSRREIDYDNKN